LKEFIADVKEHGNGFKQAHGGIGSSSHMACLLFTSKIGAHPTLVAYRGTGPALNDLMGGHVDFFCEQSVSLTEQVKSGVIKAYAVSAAQRLPALPNVPTAKEFGIDYQMSIWAGIFAPKGTPADIVDKLAGALDKALDDDGVQMRIKTLGGSIPEKRERTPAAFDKYVKGEIARWAPVLKQAAEPGH
jgi:putative tricarboxylic transport membrane protein